MASPSKQVNARMHKLSAEVGRAEKQSQINAAKAAKAVHLAALRAASGGDLKLSGVGKTGAKIGVRYEAHRSGHGVVVRATGPLQFLENKSKAHTILPQSITRGGRTKLGRRAAQQRTYDALFGGSYSGARPVRLKDGNFRFGVSHPGVQNPKQPWAKSKAKAQSAATKRVRATYSDAFKRGMR